MSDSQSNGQIISQKQVRKTIYRPTDEIGIRSIWDWSDKKKKYILRKSGNKYQAYIEKNGRTLSESFGSIHDALKWRTKIKIDFDRLPNFEIMNFEKLNKLFLDKKNSQVSITTVEYYASLMRHLDYFNNLMVEDITAKHIDAWLKLVCSEEYRKNNRIKAVRFSFMKEVELLGLIFSYYKEYHNPIFNQPVLKRHYADSIFKRDVYEKRKREAASRYIEFTDIVKLLDIFKEQAAAKGNKLLYYVACVTQLRTGMRIGEVMSLKYEDVNWVTGVYKLQKTVLWTRKKERPTFIGAASKNRKDRIILFMPEVLELFKALQKHQSRISGLIFSEDGLKITAYSSILHHYNCALREAGINFTATHIMRHSFATDFREQVVNDGGALQGILGHSSEKMTAKYAKIVDRSVINGFIKYSESILRR